MRPINLIPPEDRRGERAPARVGSLSYVIVAVLAVALIAVTMVVLTNNKISDSKAEKASLANQVAQAQVEAQRYKSFSDFAALQLAREQTVSSLAQSRFDWERVLREVSIVIPSDVWLTSVTGTASPEVQVNSDGASGSSGSSGGGGAVPEGVQGPSLQIGGCAKGHDAVAQFLAALRDVDGVTRVTVTSSDKPDAQSAAGASSTDATGATGGCQTKSFISQFSVVVAFDAAPVPQAAAPATPAPGTTPAAPTPASTTTSAADQSQVADGQQELQQQKDAAAQKTQRGRKDVNTFVPGTGTAP